MMSRWVQEVLEGHRRLLRLGRLGLVLAAALGLDVRDVAVGGAVVLRAVSLRLNSVAGVPTGSGLGSGALNTGALKPSLAQAATGRSAAPVPGSGGAGLSNCRWATAGGRVEVCGVTVFHTYPSAVLLIGAAGGAVGVQGD